MVNVADKNEIYLGGSYFKIRSPVRVANITVTPNPVVFGDTSRATDTQAMSQFIQSNTLGGSGIYKGDIRTEFDRNWWSRGETRWKYVSLPPLPLDMGNPYAANSTLNLIAQYSGNIWYFFDVKAYTFDFGTGTWSYQADMSGVPVDWVEYNNAFFVSNGGSTIDKLDSGSWSTITSTPASWLAVHDGKLYALGQSSGTWQLRVSTDGATFAAPAGQFTEGVTPNGLIVFRDAAGDQRLYAPTDRGLYIWDGTASEWLKTDVRYPSFSDAGKNPVVFRDGRMYLKIGGLSMIALDIGSTVVVTPMGLDRDDGVPPEDYGQIVGVAADYNWLWVLVDASHADELEEESFSGLDFPMVSGSWGEVAGRHTLRAWNGGWHTPWETLESGAPATTLGVFVTSDNQLVVTWGASNTAYYQSIPFGVYNARNNPDWKFAQGPVTHVTPWWDFGSQSQLKRIAHVPVQVSHASDTETVDVYVGYDLSESWEYIGQITESGLTVLKLNSGKGRAARFFRFRFDLRRGDDPFKSPILEFYNAEHMRLLPATYGFGVEIDISGNHRNRTSLQQLETLKTLSDPTKTTELVEFAYIDNYSGNQQTYYVQISRLSGIEWSGQDNRGESSYLVSLIAPYTDDVVS